MSQPEKNGNINIKVSFGAGQAVVSSSVRPLSDIYLYFAYRQASSVIAESDIDKFYRAVSVILFSALALEAGANEILDLDHLSVPEKASYESLRVTNKVKFVSTATLKWYLLFQARDSGKLSTEDASFKEIDSLFRLRNALAHFNVEKSASKAILPPQPPVVGDDGVIRQVIASVSFTPGDLFEEILNNPPKLYYGWARSVFVKWGTASRLSAVVLKYAPLIE